MKYARALLLSATLLALAGCASDSTYQTTDASGKPLPSTPWAQPQSWEQNGQLGTALGNSGASSH